MALHYFIDGYNVIRSTDWLTRGAIVEQRERLLHFIETKRPGGSARNVITVVFDGHDNSSRPGSRGSTRVIFSEDQDADSVIKDRVDALKNARDAVVVTNDRAIQRWVRGAKARVMSCDEFLRASSSTGEPPSRSEKLSAEAARRITAEFERLWKTK